MKSYKTYFSVIVATSLICITGLILFAEILNSDFYAREIKTIEKDSTLENDTLPTITFILHKYLMDESSIECSAIISNNKSFLDINKYEKIKLFASISDGFGYESNGLMKNLFLIDRDCCTVKFA